jgi:hypothetical protein
MDMANSSSNSSSSSSGSVLKDSEGRRSRSRSISVSSSSSNRSRSRSRSDVRGSSRSESASGSNDQTLDCRSAEVDDGCNMILNFWNFRYTDIMYVSTIDELTKPLMVSVESGEYNVRILKNDVGIGYVLCLKDKPIEGMKNLTKAFTSRADDPGFEHFGICSEAITNKHILKLFKNHIFKYFNVEPHHIEMLQEELEHSDDDSKENYSDYSVEKLRSTFVNLMLKTKTIPVRVPVIFYLNVQLYKRDLKNIRMSEEHVYKTDDNCYVYWKVYCEDRQIGVAIQQNEVLDATGSGNGGVVAYSEDKEKTYALGNCVFNDEDFDSLFEVVMYNETMLYNRKDYKVNNSSFVVSNIKFTDNKPYCEDIEKKIIDMYKRENVIKKLFNINYFIHHSIDDL